MSFDQFGLFGVDPAIPEGFRYKSGIITVEQERELITRIEPLPFREFEFQGYLGKRRVVSFGWRYDYERKELKEATDIPEFLFPLRETAARFADVRPEALQQALVTEYQPGAPIGWHRDKPHYGDVIGVSLVSSCQFRLRRKVGDGWERYSLTAEPRSIYLMRGPSRTEWEHSIPPVDRLRYSITFRNFRTA
jgi:alkylated DNA repair dioxygenase AlkB